MSPKNRGVIAAGHQKTAEAGQAMFELGGNAFDAAIAAVLTSCVVESNLASVAGGGFFLAHTKDNRGIYLIFFVKRLVTRNQKKNSIFIRLMLILAMLFKLFISVWVRSPRLEI